MKRISLKRIFPLLTAFVVLFSCVFCCAPKSKAANIITAAYPYQEPNVWFAVSDGSGDNVAGGSELFYFDDWETSGNGAGIITVQVANNPDGGQTIQFLLPYDIPVYRVYNGRIQKMPSSELDDFWVISSGFNDPISVAWGNHSDNVIFNVGLSFPVLEVYFTGQADIVEEFSKQNQIIDDGFTEANSWLETISNTIKKYLFSIDDYLYDLKVGINNIYTYLSQNVTQFFADWRRRVWLFEEDVKSGFDTLINGSQEQQDAVQENQGKVDEATGSLDSATDSMGAMTQPDVNVDSMVPDELNSSEFSALSSVISIFWSSPLILSYLSILAGFLLLSLLLNGQRG